MELKQAMAVAIDVLDAVYDKSGNDPIGFCGHSDQELCDALDTIQAIWNKDTLLDEVAKAKDEGASRAQLPLTLNTAYLVVGTYDDGQRWADSYLAADPAGAEELALEQYPSVTIAGVIALNDQGNMEVVR